MRYLLAILFGLMGLYPVIAATYLVSNGNHPAADFSTLTAAIAGSIAEDTIYLDGTGVSYGNLTLTSPRAFVGNGYFGQESGYGQSAILGSVSIQAGAANSSFTGLTLGAVTINDISIGISRCYITGTLTLNSEASYIGQCYLTGAVSVQATGANSVFDHCIFNYSVNGTVYTDLGTGTTIDYVTFFKGNLSLGTATYSNSIINQTKVTTVTGGSDGGGNISDTETNLTFPSVPSTDASFQLTTGSTALTSSLEGSESGAFGFSTGFEDDVYRLFGTPPIPVITDVRAASSGKEGSNLSITVEAKSNN